MKLTLSENIRQLRKDRKMTQEKLAEVLGVTVGAVYKWESGLSVPELNMIVEMADFFDISVDVLLGYKMQNNSLDTALERMNTYGQTMDPAALQEAEKILAKYPHSFRAVYNCAEVYAGYGAGSHDKALLKRAMELLEQSRLLLSQNDDPRVSDSTICGLLSVIWFFLGEQEKCLDLLKQKNAGGIFNCQIGACLSVYMNRPEESVPYLSEALLNVTSDLLTTIVSYVFIYRSRGDWTSALNMLTWGLDYLTWLKIEPSPDILGKTQAEMLTLLAYVQNKAGMASESSSSLDEARRLMLQFDSSPDYSLKNMRFAEQMDRVIIFDFFGASALDSISNIISLLDDPDFTQQWEEAVSHGKKFS